MTDETIGKGKMKSGLTVYHAQTRALQIVSLLIYKEIGNPSGLSSYEDGIVQSMLEKEYRKINHIISQRKPVPQWYIDDIENQVQEGEGRGKNGFD